MFNRSASWALPSALILVLLSSSALTAQSRFVLPHGAGVASPLAKREGNRDFFLPGRYAPSRVLCVYRAQDLKVPMAGLKLTGLALRRDGQRATAYRDHEWKQTLRISSHGVRRPALLGDASFKAAHGVDLSTVLKQKKLRYPAVARPGMPPAPFSVRLRFQQPFLLLPGRDLCMELLSESLSSARESHYWYADFEAFDRSKAMGSTRMLGRGCPFGFQTRGESLPLDGETPLRFRSYTRIIGVPRQLALLWLGAQDRSLGQLPLPLDLRAAGAPGCSLYIEPLMTLIGLIDDKDSRGTARFSIGIIPKLPFLAGIKLYAQSFVFEKSANALGVRTSSYLELRLGKTAEPLPARTLYHSSSTTMDKPTRALDGGLVLELSTQ